MRESYAISRASARRFVLSGEKMADYKATIMDNAALERATRRISHEILERNGGAGEVCLVGIRRRGVPLAEMISDNIEKIEGTRVPVGELDITFYRDDLEKKNDEPVLSDSHIPFDIGEKHVVLVDDVLYTGRTARAALEGLLRFGRPKSVQLAVLVDRGHRELPIRGDYVGKNVPTSKSERIYVRIPPYDDRMCVELYG